MTPPDPLSARAAGRDAPDAEAVILPDGAVWSWAETSVRVSALAEELRRRFAPTPTAAPASAPASAPAPAPTQTSSPARIAFVAEDRPGTLLVFLALWELGWTAVPLHERWPEAERAAYLTRLGVDARLEAPDLASFESREDGPGASPGPSASSSPSASPSPSAGHDPESIAVLVATSGSSGGPKAVALSRRALAVSARASAQRIPWRTGDRWLASLPFAHVGGLSVLTRCLQGRKALVMTPPAAPDSPRFDPVASLAWAERRQVTHLSLVPTMLRRLLDEGVAPPERLRVVLLGGAAAPRTLVEEGLTAGWPLWRTYGLTEAASQVATGRATALDAQNRDGIPLLEGLDARVVEGVLEIRGDVLFSAYEPDGATREPGDWFRTGDRARLHGRRVEILGRADDVIVTGGENVHPAEVEAALLEHPAVRDACVVGLPDERWGEAVAAAVVAEINVDASALEAHLRTRLAPFRIPRHWRFPEDLPTNAVGKVDRTAVRRLFLF